MTVSLVDLAELTDGLSDWSTDSGALGDASTDRSGDRATGSPRVLVRARSVVEVQHALAWATATRTPVVPRGTGTGLAGAASAGDGVLVLDLSGMDRIVEIRVEDQVAVVEPGVITADLDAAAGAHGLFYAPDPGSVAISTLGGNIATNAGGLRGAKYGVTRDAVLALDVVLADGRLLSVGRQTLKGVTGYDLVSLFVGSEGTLGVVVGATVRLLPRAGSTATAAAFFTSVEVAAQAATAIGAAGLRPAVLEIVDGATLWAIDAAQGSDFAERGEAFLLAQTDGFGASEELSRLVEVITPLATSVEASDDPAEAARLLTARRQALPSLERLGRVLIEDIAVPRSALAEAIRGVQDVAERTGTRIFVFGHAGDGNLHPIILLEDLPEGAGGAVAGIPPAAQRAADAIFSLALGLGGTLTGEHGIGTLKRSHVPAELGELALDLHARIKRAFDPLGILNPGKAL